MNNSHENKVSQYSDRYGLFSRLNDEGMSENVNVRFCEGVYDAHTPEVYVRLQKTYTISQEFQNFGAAKNQILLRPPIIP